MPMGRIKPLWFGASASGVSGPAVLQLLSRHSVAGFGWQMGYQTGKGGDVLQSSALAHARAFLEDVNNNHTMLFTYRQIQVSLRLFKEEKQAADDPQKDSFWLHDVRKGNLCLARQPWNTLDPFWNFSAAAATDYWLEAVVEQLVNDKSLAGGRGAVFFDEVDQGTCGYQQPPDVPSYAQCDFRAFDGARLQNASNEMVVRMVKKLNDAGIVPILSLDNRMLETGANTAARAQPCALPEDALVEKLQGTSWVRFYENFPGTYWQDAGPDLYAAMVANAILEAKAGIPTVLHVGTRCSSARTIRRLGRLGGSIEFAVAAYLIVQGPGTTLSLSNGWYDADFCWWPEFDVDFGAPLGPPVRTGRHQWERNYTRSHAIIDVSQPFADAGYVFLHPPTPTPTPAPTPRPRGGARAHTQGQEKATEVAKAKDPSDLSRKGGDGGGAGVLPRLRQVASWLFQKGAGDDGRSTEVRPQAPPRKEQRRRPSEGKAATRAVRGKSGDDGRRQAVLPWSQAARHIETTLSLIPLVRMTGKIRKLLVQRWVPWRIQLALTAMLVCVCGLWYAWRCKRRQGTIESPDVLINVDEGGVDAVLPEQSDGRDSQCLDDEVCESLIHRKEVETAS
jgi:hypothetical protein